MKPKIPMIVCSPDASWWYWTKKGCVSLDAITMREEHSFCHHTHRHKAYTWSHIREGWYVCQSGCRWGVIHRLGWDAGAL